MKKPRRGKQPTAVGSTRPPLARMIRIHEQIKASVFPNCNSLARELEVSYKSIQRDIDFMRDRWSLPIEYDQNRHGFFYSAPVGSLPTMTVSRGELVALLVAQKAIEQYRGTPFEKPIASAFDKLASSLDQEEGISIHQLAEAFSFKPASLARSEMESFSLVADAVLRGKEISFQYQGLQGGEPAVRCVQPYHLGCISDQWYVIGRDSDREAIRTFALSRMKRLRGTGQTFEKPAGFSVQKFLSGSFSAFQAKETVLVRLRLDPLAARIAAERKWHPSQKIRTLPDGGAELTLKVGIAPDLESWILSWGGRAEVLTPVSLRSKIKQAHQTAAQLYS